jgi:uncharacterized membrane protein YraQ (UPF0718 family)
MATLLLATFYAAMAGAALIVELLFTALGLVPRQRQARVVEASVTWNYTTWLNLVFLALAAFLLWRFARTGGLHMLRMMTSPLEASKAIIDRHEKPPQFRRRSSLSYQT